MSTRWKKFFKPLALKLLNLGFDVRKIPTYKYYFQFRRDKSKWLKQGGKITHNYMILSDYADDAGTIKGHYFHQDLLVARLINEHNPKRHVDVASRTDGFVAHVASFRKIEVLDLRPTQAKVENISFKIADLMKIDDI